VNYLTGHCTAQETSENRTIEVSWISNSIDTWQDL
jgi:hypothetical protein